MTEFPSAPYPGQRDVAEAVAVLAERLPAPLGPLAALAFNDRGSWIEGGAEATCRGRRWKRAGRAE